MKKSKSKPVAKGTEKTSVKKSDAVASRQPAGDAPSKEAPGKGDDNNGRSETPGVTPGVAITNHDAQDTITNQASEKEAATPDPKPEREDHQGERMGPAYIDDDSEVLRDESEHITPET